MADDTATSATDDATTTDATTTTDDATATTTTDDGLSDAGREAIRRERRAAREADKRARDLEARLKEFEDRDKTEAEKLAERAQKAESDAAEARTKLLRFEVAAAKKVPAELAEFLVGDTKAELEAKADALLAHLKPAEATNFDNGVRTSTDTTADMNALIRGAAGRT